MDGTWIWCLPSKREKPEARVTAIEISQVSDVSEVGLMQEGSRVQPLVKSAVFKTMDARLEIIFGGLDASLNTDRSISIQDLPLRRERAPREV